MDAETLTKRREIWKVVASWHTDAYNWLLRKTAQLFEAKVLNGNLRVAVCNEEDFVDVKQEMCREILRFTWGEAGAGSLLGGDVKVEGLVKIVDVNTQSDESLLMEWFVEQPQGDRRTRDCALFIFDGALGDIAAVQAGLQPRSLEAGW